VSVCQHGTSVALGFKDAGAAHPKPCCLRVVVRKQPSEQNRIRMREDRRSPNVQSSPSLTMNLNRSTRIVEHACIVIMSVSLNDDNEVAALRARCYRGIVKAPLDALDFDHPFVVGQRRDISEQNIQRLERIFERNGCLRLQEENVINAVVLDEDLPVLSALTPEQLRQIAWARDAPTLSSGKLTCISGLHRIEAAKRHLNENDKWWPVRLFSAGITFH
jgi:hypothetical protein